MAKQILDRIHPNQKVANARGRNPEAWLKSAAESRIESQLNPTKLRTARLKAGMSQADLALRTGLTISTYCAIEKGHRTVSVLTGKQISALVKVPTKVLFGVNEKNRFFVKKSLI